MSHRYDSRSQRHNYDRSDEQPSSHRRHDDDGGNNDYPSDSRRGRDYSRADSYADAGRDRDRQDDGYNSRSKYSHYDAPSSHQRRDAGNYDSHSRGDRYDDRSNRDRRSYGDAPDNMQAYQDNRYDRERQKSDYRDSYDDGRSSHPASRSTYNNDARAYQGNQSSFQRGRGGYRDNENRVADDRGYNRGGDRPSYRGYGGRDRGGDRGGDQPRHYNSDRNGGRNDHGRNRSDNMQNNAFDDPMNTESADPSNLVLDGPFMFGYATLKDQKWDAPPDTPDEVVGKPSAIIPVTRLPPKPLKMKRDGNSSRMDRNLRDYDAKRQGNGGDGKQAESEALGSRLEDSVKVKDDASTPKDADNGKALKDVSASVDGTDENVVGKKRKACDEDLAGTAVKARKLEEGEREETRNGNTEEKTSGDGNTVQRDREVSG